MVSAFSSIRIAFLSVYPTQKHPREISLHCLGLASALRVYLSAMASFCKLDSFLCILRASARVSLHIIQLLLGGSDMLLLKPTSLKDIVPPFPIF